MLRAVLREVLSQWGPRRTAVADDSLSELENLRQRWRDAAPDQKTSIEAALDPWIESHPNLKQGWTLRADWALQRKDLKAAESDYRRALYLDPLSPQAQEGLGLTLLYRGLLEEAYLHLEQAHRSLPLNAEILTHWALVSLEQGNLGDAESKLIKAIERDPRNPHAWHNLGLVCIRAGQPREGIPHIRRALEIRPDFGQAWSNLALALREVEDLEQALQAARRATELKAGHARVWVILADLLVDAGRLDDAEEALRRAEERDPVDTGVEIARAKCATAKAEHAQARAAYQRALAMVPGDPEAEGGLGQLELLCGRYDIGWDLYEARRRTVMQPVRSFGFAQWQGESLRGKTVLVHAEQGLGDNILFASCLPEVIDQAEQVVVETAPALAALFQRSFPMAIVVGRNPQNPTRDWLKSLPAVDVECSAGSLPRWTRRSLLQFPARRSYLRADPERVSHWRDALSREGAGPWIGLAWRGGMARSAGVQRSIEITALLEVLAGLPVYWASVQYGDVARELELATRCAGVPVRHVPGLMTDQDEAAALTSALSAVVTVCQTQAHLTGALGVRGVVLVPSNPNWRYGHEGSTTPWYPSLTLRRQERFGDWRGALAGLRQDLETLFRTGTARP